VPLDLSGLIHYKPQKTYIVCKHADRERQLSLGRKFVGEVPDSVPDTDGTVLVFEVPLPKFKPTPLTKLAAAKAALPSIKKALDKAFSKKGTK